MTTKEVNYELASSSWSQEEYAAIDRVVKSGMFTMGKNVKEFETKFAEKFAMEHAAMVNSGSSANLVAVAALFYKKDKPLRPGDEVIVPAISWSTSYYPLMQYGLKLRFVDVDLATLNMDVNQLEAALTPKTRMVLAVNILGNPCDLDTIKAFCDQHDLYLFEDNCESMGAVSASGKLCGTYGIINTYSTFFSHHISTMEGGVAVTNEKELHDLMLSLRSHGWTRGLPKDTQIYQSSNDDFFEAYRFILPGYNVRPGELNGAIGLEQLKKLDEFIQVRRRNAEIWQSLMADDERFIIQKEVGQSSWFNFTVILNPELNLDRHHIMTTLANSGVPYRIITGGNFLRHDVIKYCDHECVGEIKNANIAHDNGFFIGNHAYDLSEQLHYFREVIDQAAG